MLGYHLSGTFGADPEIFLRSKSTGKIIESREIIPSAGIPVYYRNDPANGLVIGKIVRDGVQVELQPLRASCRQTFSSYVKTLLLKLEDLAWIHNVELCYDTVVTFTKEELKQMSAESRRLGCQPSQNIYGMPPLQVDEDYPVRSAGGHIHLGYPQQFASGIAKDYLDRPIERQIALLDVCVGLPSVILDRTPQQERRQTYGRAGEYRMQPHGLEYRTLSNFWLRAYPLASLFLSLARMSRNIQLGTAYCNPLTNRTTVTDDLAPSLLSQFDPEEVSHTINTNDIDLAWPQVRKLQAWLKANTCEGPLQTFPFTTLGSVEYFDYLSTHMDIYPCSTTHWRENYDPENVGWGWEKLSAIYLNSQQQQQVA
jgi:hypothetical protein